MDEGNALLSPAEFFLLQSSACCRFLFFPTSRSRRFREPVTVSGFIFMETVRFLGREIAFVLYRCRGVRQRWPGFILQPTDFIEFEAAVCLSK